MTSDEWKAHQAERRKQREQDQAEARQREIDRALKVLAKHDHQSGGGDLAALKTELEALKTAHQETQAELEAAHLVVDQDYQVQRLGELTQGLRDRDARDKFFALAKDAKANPRALDMLWRLAEHQADSDEPDVRALETALERLKSEAGYCFEQPAESMPAGQPDTPAGQPAAVANGDAPRFTFANGRWSSGTN